MPGCLTKLSRHLFRYRMVCVEQNQLVHIIKGRLFQWHESCLRYIVYLSFIFNLGTHPVGVQCFSFAFFPYLGDFLCHCIFSCSFFTAVSAVLQPFARLSLNHHRWVPVFGLALVSTNLWSQRRSRGKHGAEISIPISALTGVWTSDLSLGSPARNR